MFLSQTETEKRLAVPLVPSVKHRSTPPGYRRQSETALFRSAKALCFVLFLPRNPCFATEGSHGGTFGTKYLRQYPGGVERGTFGKAIYFVVKVLRTEGKEAVLPPVGVEGISATLVQNF